MKNELEKQNNTPTIGLVIPLLFEANLGYLCSEIWLAFCTRNQQYDRLMSRDKLSYKQANNRINSQLSIENKKKMADNIIDNSDNIYLSYQQIDRLL